MLGEGNHNPLFTKDGKYRADFDDPKGSKYDNPNSWFK